MATTTKSKKTSAKPKTAKKPVTKKASAAKAAPKKTAVKSASAKKTVSKQAAAKSKATKPVVKAAVKPASAKAKTGLSASVLRKWHLLSAGIFALLAGVAAYAAKPLSADITLGHVTTDVLASGAQAVLVPAAQPLVSVEFRWYLVGILVVAAVLSVLRATRLKAREEKGIAAKVLPARWIDFGLTFGALTGLAALLAGVSDLMALKLAGLAVAVSYLFAWLAETASVRGVSSRVLRVAGVVVGLLPWVFIALSMIATTVYGDVRYNWFVYAFVAVLLAGQLSIARLQKRAANREYLAVEQDYIVQNLLIKTALAAILISGLRAL